MKINKHIRKIWGKACYRWMDLTLPNNTATPIIRLENPATNYPDDVRSSLLFYTAADSVYFHSYGAAFLNAIYTNTNQSAVHVHLFNPEKCQIDWLSDFRRHTRYPLSFSWEHVDLSELDSEKKGRFYYATRFYRFHEIVRKFNLPSMCLDIDALLIRDIDVQMSGFEKKNIDVAFYERFDKRGDNTKLLAGTLYVRPTSSGLSFLSDVSNQIRRFIENKVLIEKIDQIILYDFFKRYAKHGKLKFSGLKYPIIDLNFTEDGIIWYPKGNSKNHSVYLRKKDEMSSKGIPTSPADY